MSRAQELFDDIHEAWTASLKRLEEAAKERILIRDPEARATIDARIERLDRETVVLARALDRVRGLR